MEPIPYGKQFIDEHDIHEVISALTSDYLTQGPKIREFEVAFSNYIGAKYAVAVSNGTAALHLAALALNVNKNSKVITTPITFAASANCIIYCGGTIEFVDIDPTTGLMNLDKVKELLSTSPEGTYSGIIPVDFAGYPVDLEKLHTIAKQYNLWIIEDACHAPGGYFIDSTEKKQLCGNCEYADAAIFSFHPVKHIACGEGGMITTNNEEIYNKLLLYRTHGITKDPNLLIENDGGWYYEMQELGYNYRLTDFQAALGTSQLKKAYEGLKRRKEIAFKYDESFSSSDNIKIIKPKQGFDHAYHLYIIQVGNRKDLYDFLKQNNIFAQVHYIPVHLMPYYKRMGYNKGDFPCAENYYNQCLSLPMFPTLTNEQQEYVINTILRYEK